MEERELREGDQDREGETVEETEPTVELTAEELDEVAGGASPPGTLGIFSHMDDGH